LDKTIHLGINPIRGGIPARDKIKIVRGIFVLLLVWWDKDFIEIFLNDIIKDTEIEL
jgi:hypothetical protein